MARQHGGELYDFEQMTDDEIRSVVVEHLREYPNLDAGWIDVRVRDGRVTLGGQVGTDSERLVAEEVVHDVLGIQNYANELVIDELHRGELPEAADEAATLEEEIDDQVGDVELQQSDTAEHLMENLDAETYGTHDLGTSIRDGTPYVPPDRPVADGYGSGENH
jgi:hypothetical protein